MCCPQFKLNLKVELDNPPGVLDGSTTSRKCTDVPALVIMVIYFGAIIVLLGYCIYNSDIDQITNGYDDYGNICGRNNMEEKKYVRIKTNPLFGESRMCVEQCPQNTILVARIYCIPEKDTSIEIPLCNDLLLYWKYVILSWLVTVVYSLIMLCFLIIFITKTIQCPSIILLLIILVISFVSWIFVSYGKGCQTYMMIIGIITTIAFFVLVTVYFLTQLKIYFTTQLFLVATEAIRAVPFLIVQPIISSILITTFVFILIYSWVYLQTFSEITLELVPRAISNKSKHKYITFPIATITGYLMICTILLLYEFVKHCQYMVVAGCVAKWYYTNRTDKLSKPIRTTILDLVKYHLGTIFLGCIILNIIYILRSIINAIKAAGSGNNRESAAACPFHVLSETCLTSITCLSIFSRNAYIMTAIYGYSFFKGTLRAFKLITQNIYNVAVINSFGDSVLLSAKFVIFSLSWVSMFLALYFDEEILHKLFSMVFFGGLCFILSDCFISIFEVTIDTLFLCFCEDCLYKYGPSKPYHMSTHLAQFVENANKYIDPVTWQNIADKWEEGPERVYSFENFFEKHTTYVSHSEETFMEF